ncbi:MAG: hypothetical protein C0609_12250 [Deltaproteobacteria bacterium]|nr:MAG: hypothetical protein C0609_12250 [Deltaproteobacteria bacterium]
MIRSRLLVAALFLSLMTLAGCGYHLVGSELSGGRGFAAGPVDDLSREPLFGPYLRAAMASRIVERGGAGEITISVLLHRVDERARAFVVGDIPREYLLTATADYTLIRGGETIFKETGVTAEQEFAAGLDINATRSFKEAGLRTLAKTLADKILVRATLAMSREERAKR